MKIVKLTTGMWKNESRDIKELDVCRSLGYDVSVIAKGQSSCKDIVSDYPVDRLKNKYVPNKFIFKYLNKVLTFFVWSHYVRKQKIDILTCHDITALSIGYWANLFKKNKFKLIYDAHEFEVGRDADRNKFQIFLIKHLEKFLIKRVSFSIVVNDTIANEMVKLHKLKERPVVIRNVPYYWKLDNQEIGKTRTYLQELTNSDKSNFLIMYHGGLSRNRGIENTIRAISTLNFVKFIILGNGDCNYKQSLVNLCKDNKCCDRVFFIDAVPEHDLYKYVGAVDIGMVTLVARHINHYYALPNKFFQNIQSLTPVIASDFPELRQIINKYNIGLLVDPDDPNSIADAIIEMYNNKDKYLSFKENLKVAKDELCFENEKAPLECKYKEFLNEN